MNPWYTEYSEYLAEKFPGGKVQKISINAGFSCPNRDGTIGTGGCIYCDNSSFTPGYCNPSDSVTVQLSKGVEFFRHKYPEMRFLAYFQSYTATHRRGIETLRSLYDEAAGMPGVKGLVIGTRPDCLPDDVLKLLEEFNRRLPVIVEIGAETSDDSTLRRINRRHSWRDVEDATRRLVENGIDVGLHLIAGLPGENSARVLQSVDDACRLPVSTLKLHQLQIIRNTTLHSMVDAGELVVKPFSLEDYLELCADIVARVPRHIAIDRFVASAPPGMVVAPRWGLKNHEFVDKLHKILKIRNNSLKKQSLKIKNT